MRRMLGLLSIIALSLSLTTPAAASAEAGSGIDTGLGAFRVGAEPTPAVHSLHESRASVRTATWRDAADGPIPQRDLRRLETTHNRSTGELRAEFGLDAAPTQATTSVAVMYLGHVKDAGCAANALILSATHVGTDAQWATFNASGDVAASGKASYDRSGAKVTLKAKARALRKDWNCTFARLSNDAADVTYDQTGYARLSTPPRPKLDLSTPDTRAQTSGAVGDWKRVKVQVENDFRAEATARGVRVKVSEPNGVQVKPRTLSFKAIKPGDERTKSVRIKLTKRATKSVELTVSAKNSSKHKRTLTIHPKPKPMSKKLVGRYFWGFESHQDYAWDNRAVAFVNKRFAYVGFPKRGVPKCKSGKGKCVRYKYNKRTGKLTVGGRKGHYRKGHLVLGGIAYYATKLPEPGARWTVSLGHNGFSGCQIGMPCTTWTHSLTLRKSGKFSFDTFSITTGRDGSRKLRKGHGRYQIRRNGHLVLNYSKGKTLHTTIAIDTDSKRRPDVYGAGLIVGDINFYP